MPVFEYECLACGVITEVAEQMNSGRIAARKCRACGGRRLKRVMSSFAYHPEVTLEDLGVNVAPQPASPMPQQPQGPPPGGCPYENMAKEEEARKKKEKENPTFFL